MLSIIYNLHVIIAIITCYIISSFLACILKQSSLNKQHGIYNNYSFHNLIIMIISNNI